MDENRTVSDILERVRASRREKRCPDCDGFVTIRGLGGAYRWECLHCDALGFGYPSRAAALDGLRTCRR